MTIPFIDILAQRGHLATEEKAKRVISLPMSAYLDEPTQDAIIESVHSHG
jgi:dTDP-4-amino-4,6-dideoxygalactose transaminase